MAVTFLPQTQIQYPGNADVSQNINALGETISKSLKEGRNRNALIKVSNALQNKDLPGARAAALESGDPSIVMNVNSLLSSQEDREFRKDEATRSQRNSDRSYGLQVEGIEGGKVPAGFQKTAEGLQPVPGGPEDPVYLKKKTEATDKGRQLTVTDITKLSEEGGKYSNLTGFITDFKPEYAGYKIPALGNAAMAAGRYLPEGVVGKDVAQAATFWQGYDRYKNVVRNDLFGSALTKSETQAFEKADVSPGMDPEQIKKNLAMQKSIVENGLKRKASAMIAAGYKPDAIAAAYGLDPRTLGGTSTAAPTVPMPGTQPAPAAAAPAPAAPVRVSSPQEHAALPSGAQYIAPDGSVRTKQ